MLNFMTFWDTAQDFSFKFKAMLELNVGTHAMFSNIESFAIQFSEKRLNKSYATKAFVLVLWSSSVSYTFIHD